MFFLMQEVARYWFGLHTGIPRKPQVTSNRLIIVLHMVK